jgi:hypothetical protein
MPQHGAPLAAAAPVAAGHVLVARDGASVGLRAGQYVTHIGTVAASIDHCTLFVERRVLVEIIGAMELVHVLGDHDALGVVPGSLADPVARIARRRTAGRRGAQIGAPRVAARARRLGQGLAEPIRELVTKNVMVFCCANALRQRRAAPPTRRRTSP